MAYGDIVERQQTFQQIGDAGFNLLAKAIGADSLKSNLGRGTVAIEFGAAGFAKRAALMGLSSVQIDQKTEELNLTYRQGQALCESPIERDVLAALLTAPWCEKFGTIPPKVHDAKNEDALPIGDIVIVPQMAFVRFRVDFAVVASAGAVKQMVVIECDGAAYHTDVAKDSARTTYFASWGIPLCRIRGKDIYTDPDDAIRSAVNFLNDWRGARE